MNDYLSKTWNIQRLYWNGNMQRPNSGGLEKVMRVRFGRRSHLKIKMIKNSENLFGYGKNN